MALSQLSRAEEQVQPVVNCKYYAYLITNPCWGASFGILKKTYSGWPSDPAGTSDINFHELCVSESSADRQWTVSAGVTTRPQTSRDCPVCKVHSSSTRGGVVSEYACQSCVVTHSCLARAFLQAHSIRPRAFCEIPRDFSPKISLFDHQVKFVCSFQCVFKQDLRASLVLLNCQLQRKTNNCELRQTF